MMNRNNVDVGVGRSTTGYQVRFPCTGFISFRSFARKCSQSYISQFTN